MASTCGGSPTTTKTLYMIRHAESEENRRLGSLQTVLTSLLGFSWPNSSDVYASLELLNISGQVNSPVSGIGKKQIENMKLQLQGFLQDRDIQLILHSPLTRAKETCLGLFEGATVEETPLLLEKTPIEWILSSSFIARLQEFQEDILSRPESRIVVVGHSQFFKALLNLVFKFDNCDVWQVELRSKQQHVQNQVETIAVENKSCDFHELKPQWSNLQQLYVCNVSSDENASA